MITVRRSVIATVAAATMLTTFTSAGTADDAAVVNCTVDLPTVTVATGGTAVEASTAAQCTLGPLTVFKVSMVAKATGSQCAAPAPEVVPNPALVPTWIMVRVVLACNPSADGKVGNKVTIKMLGLKDVTLASYGLGDSLVDKVATNVHKWKIGFVAGIVKGIDKLPPINPGSSESERTVFVPEADDGSCSKAQGDHEVQAD